MSPLITISLQQGAEKKTPKTVHHLEIFLVLLILKDPYKAHKVRLNFRKPMNIYPWKDVFLTCQAISTMGNFLHKNSCYGLPCTRKRVFFAISRIKQGNIWPNWKWNIIWWNWNKILIIWFFTFSGLLLFGA